MPSLTQAAALDAATRTTTTVHRIRPYVEVTLFVAVWMALGVFVSQDANIYLLMGVPLTAAFQLLVRRRPLRALWVRNAPSFRLDAKGVALAVALMAVPAFFTVQAALAGQWVGAGWMLCAAAGAVAAAYALRRFRRGDASVWLHWVATATVTGVVVLAAALVPAALASGRPLEPLPMLLTALQTLLLYVPVQFVLEEVSFRGALDSHVAPAGARRGWVSALVVSALWGLWHVPIAPAGTPLLLGVAQALLVHVVIGVPLSLAWRRTGNLTVPVLAHALIDAFRNALLVGM